MPPIPSSADPYEAALAHSRYVARLASTGLTDRESFNALASAPFGRDRMRTALHPVAHGDCTSAPLPVRLRTLRRDCLLALIGRDLVGLATLHEVMATMTALAEETLSAACASATDELRQVYGNPIGEESGRQQPLLVIGMGKLGGGELNVSSDIDLVFVYPEEGETRGGTRSISNHEYFVRCGRRIIALLNEPTGDGFVFRVDMRLRPYGDSGPLACSLAMLEEYFIAQGREWERYAWIKGRVVARTPLPDTDAGSPGFEAGLTGTVQPFVFRRHLDFSAIASMRELSGQIRREVRRRDMLGNIKLGAGGIRQIEFVAQVFQLIRGGSDLALRARPTLDVLDALKMRSILEAPVVERLKQGYDLLRRLEHRLQYLDDAQTHALPESDEDRHRIALSMGHADWPSFATSLDALRESVGAVFEQACAFSPGAQADHPLSSLWQDDLEPSEAAATLAGMGYRAPERLAGRLLELRGSARVKRMAASGQSRLSQLIPRALEVAAALQDPDAAIAHLLDIIVSIGRRESYLALLLEYPPVLQRLGELASASPWASDYLALHPILLDELIDARTLHAPPSWPRLIAELRDHLDSHADNVERLLDTLRHFRHAQVFRIVAQDLAGDLPLERVSDRLSELAEVVLAEALERCWKHLNAGQSPVPAARFGIIGYGKLGGKEMGYGSDLDIAFIFDDAPVVDDAARGPARALPEPVPPERYARLALRLNSWLTSMTSAGVLYATDLRLRPDGESGLLAPSMTAFEQYQREKAWVWEHQALTRARFVAGDPALGARFERLRIDILCQPRDIERLRGDIVDMRRRMRESKHGDHPAGTFDIKQGVGGLVDLEFIVQFLVLAHAAQVPELTGNIGNIALLQVAASRGLVDPTLAQAAQVAYRTLRRTQHAMQLAGRDPARAPVDALDSHAAAVDALWQAAIGAR
ncbi:MAG: bifunctional [glutamate--ammonia ligase]-adenylyl-L-tyrosine phosphorylase/[glutamate--ammonia-ligase] adenylyltransferase [bacterium]|nr:bifunctional [glutamate--ammonia ligase]-adenylyl-L-tyrosine phosphorylase/[glutamate--ammonia-ligase] adenylyltransferase [Rhodocyclaceae bacterium]MCA4902989.1 bifunctional [glutamate--ammonia ligase]-adenylyl-L-tyrosine phosphorylase/[glutamate--ammonia-ligase] adenylyltransferase [Rhodocyclaceae bacterium]MCE2981017.1 bifunctional [glutamate--ammonia ligase]-adenylyl-L-tyrosine phosphorylase/[glutamate--ammonia-ligase] adenylyltransferase [Betaproteobacteria bacterium]